MKESRFKTHFWKEESNCHKMIPEFISGSSTQVVTQEKRQVWKMLGSRIKTLRDGAGSNAPVQQLSNFITAKGFTLIELLVVILIIGILAAVALPQYQKAVDRAQYKTVIAVLHTIRNAENLYKLEHGDYTVNWEELARTGIDIPHTSISQDKTTLYGEKGYYFLSTSGTYWNVNYRDNQSQVRIYSALPVDNWLCYPMGTVRGKQICKHLGCDESKLDNLSCGFNPGQ